MGNLVTSSFQGICLAREDDRELNLQIRIQYSKEITDINEALEILVSHFEAPFFRIERGVLLYRCIDARVIPGLSFIPVHSSLSRLEQNEGAEVVIEEEER